MISAALVCGAQAAAYATAHPLTIGDYTGDHKTDLTVYRPGSTSSWFFLNSGTGAAFSNSWGTYADIPVSGDFRYGGAADGITDVAVFRPSNGTWYWIDSVNGLGYSQAFGGEGDIPAVGDYDGDGLSDITVWRSFPYAGYSGGTWFVLNSHNWTMSITQWGLPGDIPVSCDYDGDGKSDYAVYRPSNGTWYIARSGLGGSVSQAWGTLAGDMPVPADYDGDGKCDLAVWRPSNGNYIIQNSSTGGTRVTALGQSGDIPEAGDYDGDGRADLMVWRPYNGTWYGVKSSNGGSIVTGWGTGGPNNGGIGSDVPLPNLPGSQTMIDDILAPQQQSNWCWAATAQMASGYSYVSMPQCQQANVAFGRSDCCTNPTSASSTSLCNQGGWWDQMLNFGFTYTDLWNSSITFAQLQGELNANRPVPFAWAWTGGGGHAMVAIKTWVNGLPWVSINNPDPVNVGEQDDMTYSRWVSAADHTHWRDSYNVTVH